MKIIQTSQYSSTCVLSWWDRLVLFLKSAVTSEKYRYKNLGINLEKAFRTAAKKARKGQ